jgi:hypothetical protein
MLVLAEPSCALTHHLQKTQSGAVGAVSEHSDVEHGLGVWHGF